MTNQPNKATVKDGLPTAYQVLNNHLSKMGLTMAVAHESILLDAMQEYSDQQNAELRERVKELEVKLELAESDEPFWKSELGLSEARIKELNNRVEELESLMQEFVDQVDRGEVRSKKTYAKFKEALK